MGEDKQRVNYKKNTRAHKKLDQDKVQEEKMLSKWTDKMNEYHSYVTW